MQKETMREQLSGKDLRSISKVDYLVDKVTTQVLFDQLFQFLYDEDRLVVMRSADAIEKITLNKPTFLATHKEEVFLLCKQAENKELKWHLALLLSRFSYTSDESDIIFSILRNWLLDQNESRIVRTNALQALYDLTVNIPWFQGEFSKVISQIQSEAIPALHARIRKLQLKT
ncbi:hypothetical protein ACYSNW_07600 [Enterococcus sp. LJL99]